MFDNFRRFGRICSVISVGSVRFGSVTGFIHSPHVRPLTTQAHDMSVQLSRQYPVPGGFVPDSSFPHHVLQL